MQQFIAKFGDRVQGVLSGWDRLVFRGSIRSIQYARGMRGFLWHKQLRLKDFGPYAERTTRDLKEASLAEAKRLQRPTQYLLSSKQNKRSWPKRLRRAMGCGPD